MIPDCVNHIVCNPILGSQFCEACCTLIIKTIRPYAELQTMREMFNLCIKEMVFVFHQYKFQRVLDQIDCGGPIERKPCIECGVFHDRCIAEVCITCQFKSETHMLIERLQDIFLKL
jgi:hypothetical protein